MQERSMKKYRGSLTRGAAALALAIPSAVAFAQELPRSFVASPEIYKVIAENTEQRVIAVTWKPGQRDAMHSHPSSAVYYLSDCSLRIHVRDGPSRDVQPKAGMAVVQMAIAAHAVENIGPADCRLVMVEPR
jgi:quercetin dioxygenase-like cupin family protein